MSYRIEKGCTQEVAAAKLAISVRSGRKIERGMHHTNKPKLHRSYKTRKSPIDEVWKNELEPMLRKNPSLQAKTLLIHLQRTHRDAQGNPIYTHSIERTLQRRVREWSALHGGHKEVMFPQIHRPGEQGLSDFTHFLQASITIQGEVFKHMFYHFRLVYSKWDYLKVIQSGESMQALSEGLQEALLALGGAPKEHRTDSLSAAYKNRSPQVKRDMTQQYEALCAHYNMVPTRNNKGCKHENGSVESAHGHLKNRLSQELLLRGSCDFDSVFEYEAWVHTVVEQSNRRNSVNFKEEQSTLQPLPVCKTADYALQSVKVPSSSIITVKRMRYSLPSRLCGQTLTLHIYQKEIKVYLGRTYVLSLDRKYYKQHGGYHVIDYKHVIHALIKKPGAFRWCQYRDALFPSETYRLIWRYIEGIESRQTAPKLMLRLLKLAADHDCEEKLGEYVIEQIRQSKPLQIEVIEARFNGRHPVLPTVSCQQHRLADYDQMIDREKRGGWDASL